MCARTVNVSVAGLYTLQCCLNRVPISFFDSRLLNSCTVVAFSVTLNRVNNGSIDFEWSDLAEVYTL